MKVLVLGAGRIGRTIAIDLAAEKGFEVCVADRDQESLNHLPDPISAQALCVDLSKSKLLTQTIRSADLVVNALPGFLGFSALKTSIEKERNVVDIAFAPENPFELDALAKKKGVTAIVDAGVAPGLSNILVGSSIQQLSEVQRIEIYVGGLPATPQGPFRYKAPFSPIDVIAEYTRPARLMENGEVVTRPALSDLEHFEIPDVGEVEAFLTDGLRTLLHTVQAPHMKEKTIRYPGHARKVALLRDTGFFSDQPIQVGDTSIRPIDLTSEILFPLWELKKGEPDLTVLRVMVEGIQYGVPVQYQFDLLDRYDEKSQTTSMARTTGFTASLLARLVAKGIYENPGVNAPESVGQDPKSVEILLAGLRERGVHCRQILRNLRPK